MNIPSNDPGLKMVRFWATFCEWLVRFANQIATCVESAEMIVDHNATAGRIPVSVAEDQQLTQDLIDRGQASANGATDYLAASAQMTRLGIQNDAFGADWFAHNDFVPLVKAAINRGQAVLFGLYAAHLLHDDWTNTARDAGVDGHGIAIVGYDATGAIVADPNTAEAQRGDLVHYSWANLKAAGGSYPSMVIPRGSLMPTVTPTWNAAAGTLTFPAHDGLPQIVLDHAQAYFARPDAHMRDGLYPLGPAGAINGAGDSAVYWSDSQRTVSVKADGWAIHLESTAAEMAAGLSAPAQINTLDAQVATLQKQLAAALANQAAPESDAEKAQAAAWRSLQGLLTTVK